MPPQDQPGPPPYPPRSRRQRASVFQAAKTEELRSSNQQLEAHIKEQDVKIKEQDAKIKLLEELLKEGAQAGQSTAEGKSKGL